MLVFSPAPALSSKIFTSPCVKVVIVESLGIVNTVAIILYTFKKNFAKIIHLLFCQLAHIKCGLDFAILFLGAS